MRENSPHWVSFPSLGCALPVLFSVEGSATGHTDSNHWPHGVARSWPTTCRAASLEDRNYRVARFQTRLQPGGWRAASRSGACLVKGLTKMNRRLFVKSLAATAAAGALRMPRASAAVPAAKITAVSVSLITGRNTGTLNGAGSARPVKARLTTVVLVAAQPILSKLDCH